MSQKLLVAGGGKSGIAASMLALKTGVPVVLYDSNGELDSEALRSQFVKEDEIEILLGELKVEALGDVGCCVISPGIPLEAPFVHILKEKKIPIISELELAYQHGKGRLAAITGTNGKTTTTALTGAIVSAYYKEVFVVGNIGTPYASTALRSTDQSVTVAEVSSFQLESAADFKPDISAILNITPDHLNRHKTMECYIEVKERIAKNQTEAEACILNYDDPVLRRFGEGIKPRVTYFSSREILEDGFSVDGNEIVWNRKGERDVIADTGRMKLLGRHNHENVMAAAAIAMELKVPLPLIRSVIEDFAAVEHRIEYVTEKAGVKYYNDSKGTNPDAAIQAVNAMPGTTLLIAGGYDKDSEFDEWIKAFGNKVKYLVLLGQTRDKIAECAARHGFENVMFAEDMEEAVKVCASYANAGEYVLLSPACASWGMFENYEERGNVFKECVRQL